MHEILKNEVWHIFCNKSLFLLDVHGIDFSLITDIQYNTYNNRCNM